METVELVKMLQLGNRNAYIEMYSKYSDSLYFLCKKLTLDNSKAVMALEGSFTAAYKNIGKLARPEGFEKWLFAIAITRCRTIARRFDPQAFTMRTDGISDSIPCEGTDEDVFPEDDKKSLEIFNKAFDLLPDYQRLAVLMYYYCEMNENEIARFFSCSAENVRFAINAARETLRLVSDKACESGHIPFGTGILPVLSDALLLSASHCKAPFECQENVLQYFETAVREQKISHQTRPYAATAPRIKYDNKNAKKSASSKKSIVDFFKNLSTLEIWAYSSTIIAIIVIIIISSALIKGYNEENGHRNLNNFDTGNSENIFTEANAGTETEEYTPTTTEAETHNFEKDEESESYVCAHNFSGEGTVVEPTCTEKGYTEHICTKCSEKVKDSFVEATGHSFGNWIEDENNGTRSRTCKVCEYVETEKITDKDTETETENNTETESETEQETLPEIEDLGLVFQSNGDGTCSLSGIGSFSGSSLSIPKQAPNGDTVTSISYFAFAYNTNITSLIIANTVTSISDYAFSGCTALRSVSIPSSVTTIGANAFSDCESINTVYYGGSAEDFAALNIGSGNDALINAYNAE